MNRFQVWPDITSLDQAMKQLRQHDRMVRAFYDDPMSKEAPAKDFQDDFDKREFRILNWIANNAPENSPERQMALSRMHRFLP